MKKYLFILTFSISQFVISQTSTFRDDFNSNINKWPVCSTEFDVLTIEDGFLTYHYIKKPVPEINRVVIKNKIKFTPNWDIETCIKVVELVGSSNSYGIVLGEKDKGNSHYFSVSPNLKMSWFFNLTFFKEYMIKNEPLPLDIFKKDNETNGTKFFLSCREGFIKFFVNDIFIARIESPKAWLGNGIGIFVKQGMKVKVDYIEIKQY